MNEKRKMDHDLLDHLAMEVNWRPWELEVFRRADGHCEYCGKDLFASSDAFYFEREFDHIVPTGGDGPENRALACRPCNFIKRRYLPVGGSRAELVANAAGKIRERRERNDLRLARDVEWFRSTHAHANAP
jgi:5-methylcytosine-specific restriction endonuclease McrA